jgi:hypothetical protein
MLLPLYPPERLMSVLLPLMVSWAPLVVEEQVAVELVKVPQLAGALPLAQV